MALVILRQVALVILRQVYLPKNLLFTLQIEK